MSDFKRDLRHYIDGLEEPVSVQETMSRRRERRFRVPAAVLAGAAIVMIPAMVLVGLRMLPANEPDVAESTVPPTTTALLDTTTTSTSRAPAATVVVPDIVGLSEAEARSALESVGLTMNVVETYFYRTDIGTIRSQSPEPQWEAPAGSEVQVGIAVLPDCAASPQDHSDPADGEMAVTILLECADNNPYPGIWTPVVRLVPASEDAIAATLVALVEGPNATEVAAGYVDPFWTASGDDVRSVTLDNGQLIVDFTPNIFFPGANTSTGSTFFAANLQANLFQFEAVDSIEFRIDGSCTAFGDFMEMGSECAQWTRTRWEQILEEFTTLRAVQPLPLISIPPDEVVGKTFTASRIEGSSAIVHTIDGELRDSGYSEVGGWTLDDPTTDNKLNWAIHVAGQGTEMVWLVESLGYGDGQMVYVVKATVELPWNEITLTADPFVMGGMESCSIDGVSDPALVVMALGGGSEEMDEIRAWTVNVPAAAFEEIAVARVECSMETG